MRLAIAAATLLALAGSAAAQTVRKVPQDYPTIAAAEAACNPGDTIKIAKGKYFENVTLNVADVKVLGSGVVWDGNIAGTDGNCLSVYSSGVTVQGITFRNGATQVYSEGGNFKVAKCTFIDADGSAINIDSGAGNSVTGCKIRGAGSDGVHSDGSDTIVAKCAMRSVSQGGIVLHASNGRAEGNTITLLEGAGVSATAASVVIARNRIFNCGGQGIGVTSTGAVVSGNTVQKVDGDFAIHVTGANASLEKNRCVDNGGGIYVAGDGALVLSNRVSDVHGNQGGFQVVGDDMTVAGNSAIHGSGDSFGFWLYSATVSGDGVIERNRASEMSDSGFYLLGIYNCEVTALTATNCGAEDEAGISIEGSDNTFTKLVVSGVDNVGIWIESGTGNDFTACAVKDCTGDGYRVEGTSQTFTDCTAANCGEGLDNRGTGTVVTGGKYRGDRFDITNTGTIPAGLDTVDYVTGGEAFASQVD